MSRAYFACSSSAIFDGGETVVIIRKRYTVTLSSDSLSVLDCGSIRVDLMEVELVFPTVTVRQLIGFSDGGVGRLTGRGIAGPSSRGIARHDS